MNKKAITLPLLALGGIALAQNDPQRPNVIFILGDDMGFSGLQCYGGDGIPSPNLDYLAQNGIVCTNFRSNAPVSSPTRVSILTGSYQQRVGLNHIFSEIDPMDGLDPAKHPTFANDLQDAGYRTGVMGKWHLGQDIKFNPLNNGFDEWHGYTMGNIDFHSHYNTQHKIDWWDRKEVKDEPGYVTHLINKYSVEFIRESVKQEKPFFLFVSHNAVHVPMQGPNDPPLRTPDTCPYRNDQDMSDEEYKRVYRDMVQAMDEGVGQMRAVLEELGVAENTLIIYTSDNGGEAIAAEKYPGNNGYFRGAKGSLYEGGVSVPAIFYYPTGWGHRVTGEDMVSMDIMPTILDFCGVMSDRRTDGISCLNHLRAGTPLPERKLFWANTGAQSMIDCNWKLMWTRGRDGVDKKELFNLFTDRKEQHDLSTLYPEKVEQMSAEILNWWNDVTKDTKLEGRTTFNSGWYMEITPEQMRKMRAANSGQAKK